MKRSVIPKALKKKLPLRIWISIAIRQITGPKDFSLFLPIRCLTYLFNITKRTIRGPEVLHLIQCNMQQKHSPCYFSTFLFVIFHHKFKRETTSAKFYSFYAERLS